MDVVFPLVHVVAVWPVPFEYDDVSSDCRDGEYAACDEEEPACFAFRIHAGAGDACECVQKVADDVHAHAGYQIIDTKAGYAGYDEQAAQNAGEPCECKEAFHKAKVESAYAIVTRYGSYRKGCEKVYVKE